MQRFWPFGGLRGVAGDLDLPQQECYNRRNGVRRVTRGTPNIRGPALDIYELTVETEFAAAHRLREYEGNCERLHGHNWKVDVVLRGEALDALGMVIDFRDAKRLVGEVLGELDHSCLNDLTAFQEQNPTTENVARTIYEALAAKLPDGVSVARVTAWESDHCGVSYSRMP